MVICGKAARCSYRTCNSGDASNVQVGLQELWERQHEVACVLRAAGVKDLLEALVNKSQALPSQPWVAGWPENPQELHISPQVDAIKVNFCSPFQPQP